MSLARNFFDEDSLGNSKVMSLRSSEGSVQWIAKPSAYRPKGGKPTVCSLAGNFRQNPYAVGSLALASPSRTYGLPVDGDRRAVGALASVRLLKNVPAVGELTLAMRRGFLFVGKAGKKDRGGSNG
jgi:hypothetical protein